LIALRLRPFRTPLALAASLSLPTITAAASPLLIACHVPRDVLQRFALLGCCILKHPLRLLAHPPSLLLVACRLALFAPLAFLRSLPAPLALAAFQIAKLLRDLAHRLRAGQIIGHVLRWISLALLALPFAMLRALL
jgi:hypothetical protein